MKNGNSYIFGETIKYEVEIYQPTATFHGYLEGVVKDIIFNSPIPGVAIKTDMGGSAITDSQGCYQIVQKSGICNVEHLAPGYAPISYSEQIIEEDKTKILNFDLEPMECPNSTVAKIILPSSSVTIRKGEWIDFKSMISGGKSPYQYLWYFGGAPNSDQKDPEHVVFEKTGTFTPVLYVKDANGCINKTQFPSIQVNDIPLPIPADSGGGGCFIRSVF